MDYYKLSAQHYDRIYSFKNYATEVEKLKSLFAEHTSGNIKNVLEVACGTGNYLDQLNQHNYTVEGLDISPNMVKAAKQKLPDLNLYKKKSLR